jgi:carbamate kinase
MERMVIALGGNALGKTPETQLEAVRTTAGIIADLIKDGYDIILTHGNGPQVGMINLAFEGPQVPDVPFPECGAMSQGYIGYHLQNALRNELDQRSINKSVVSLVTQVIVDQKDPAFDNPSKPVGSFYTKEEAEKLQKEKGYIMEEDAGRGYRRVVPSPEPLDIVEIDIIRTLVKNGHLVIACGGGGVPVVQDKKQLKGIPAVIDKDLASGRLAHLLDADILLILTAVEQVALNFRKENQKWIQEMNVEYAQKYLNEGHFARGSMAPKIKAAIEFANSRPDRKSIITSLDRAREGLEGKTGTIIKKYTGKEGLPKVSG